MSDNKFLPILSQNLLEILGDEEYYDVTIEVGNDPYVQIFRSHMVILNYRSPYLRRILSTNKKKNDGTLTHIKLPNISPEIFQIILKYIYGGKLSLEEFDASYIVKIMVAANELSLQELIPHSQSFLIDNQANWIEQNFVLMPAALQTIQTISSESVNSNKQIESISNVDSINIDSIIITTQHAELISKWIDILEITDKAKNFESIENYLLSRVKDKEHAINFSKKLCPSFGEGDLTLLGATCFIIDGKRANKCYCKKSSYEKPIRKSEDKFFIEDYEVFQINI
ncbi:uncharacterized protein OCT59_021100 [Rhizophagus irregularis]|uniref:uncharacterized protein n=1 Tax=Rhizophagus irregularis TaxID=588596 RepID=UPI00332E2153|nr:hypothetical protein OCT59_021100 [Rhizophagus irregularis]